MAKNVILEQLKKEFKGKLYFTRESLLAFYRHFDPDLNESTFRWRLYYLKEKRIITPISQDLFTLSYKPIFKPDISDVEKIAVKAEKQFPTLKYCFLSTKAVSEFSLHIPGKYMTILEVEIDALEPLYEYLNAKNFNNVFITKPIEKKINRYILESDHPNNFTAFNLKDTNPESW